MNTIEKLSRAIESGRNDLKTDRLDMSYGEIMSMYENKEIIISPQFQRLFRWDTYQRTRFIESILLGVPTPPIFVAENDKGNWELVDGLQRISTVISFFGKLKEHKENNLWVMEKGPLISELEDYSSETLPDIYLKNIKRTYCRVEIIKWNSEYDMRYELFNRLNTGGSPLTEQEIRNCIFRGISEKFNDLLLDLSKDENFIKLTSLSSQKIKELYNQELVLRFLALYNSDLAEIETKNISEFMTDYMKKEVKNSNFDYENNKNVFTEVMKILSKLDSTIFKFNNNQFSTSLYDAITVGIAKNANKYKDKSKDELLDIINSLKGDTNFRKYVGSAASSKTRVVKRMEIALGLFENV